MPMVTECLIKIDAALALRDLARALNLKTPKGDLGFLCPHCKQPVKTTAQGEDPNAVRYEAHFEHLDRNSTCRLSHKAAATP
jgi:hypothetical protein